MRRALLLCAAALFGCSGEPAAGYPSGPHAIALGATLPDLRFDGVTETGSYGEVSFSDYFAPGEERWLLVVVSGGLWCGTCRISAEHAADLLGQDVPIRRLDLVLGDRDNAPADADAAAAWQQAFDLHGVAVGADPAYRLRALLEDREAQLPLFVIVDASTMTALDVLDNPPPGELRARLAGAANDAVAPLEDELVDDFFHQNEWELLRATRLPDAPPPNPTNAVADSPAAAALGRALFFDADLSPSGTVACASCHRPDAHLSDGLPRARGVAQGDRRTPSIALAAHARWQFWDGRADSLWAQALAPFENPLELGSSRVFVARRVLGAHGAAYREAFPDAPAVDTSAWPESGKPGDAAYDALAPAAQHAITRVFVQAGKAIEAWERTIRVKPNPLDAYLGGDFDALSAEQTYGLQLFVRSGCMQCHWGPRLTDDAFHNLRMPTGRRDGAADRGRLDGLSAWQASEFRSDGVWSDRPTEPSASAPSPALLGQFKTPPLRGVAHLSFFGHGGAMSHLAEVTESYGLGGVPAGDSSSIGEREPWLVHFGETVQWGLVPLLEILSAEPLIP